MATVGPSMKHNANIVARKAEVGERFFNDGAVHKQQCPTRGKGISRKGEEVKSHAQICPFGIQGKVKPSPFELDRRMCSAFAKIIAFDLSIVVRKTKSIPFKAQAQSSNENRALMIEILIRIARLNQEPRSPSEILREVLTLAQRKRDEIRKVGRQRFRLGIRAIAISAL